MKFDAKNVPFPLQRKHIKRLPEEVKTMEVGQSFLCDYPTAQSFRSFGVYNGWETCRQKIGEFQFRCWRTK